MPYLNTNGTRLFYQDWQGTTGAATVVFVHGWSVSGASWEYQMLPLNERGLRCVAYDQRGCGRSDDPGTGWDYDTLADDLAALLEHLDLRDVTLVGHSMGGGVVSRYIVRCGRDNRASRIVLAGSTTPFLQKTPDHPHGLDESTGHAILERIRRDRARYIAEIAPGFVGEGLPGCAASPEMLQWAVGLTLQASPRAAVEMFRTAFWSDQRTDLPRIDVPAMILHGDSDQSCPLELTGRRTAALITGSHLAVYETTPHGLFLTHTERFNADLLSFIGA